MASEAIVAQELFLCLCHCELLLRQRSCYTNSMVTSHFGFRFNRLHPV